MGVPVSVSAQPQKPSAPSTPAPIATVNGKAISAQRLDDVVNQLSSQGRADTPELRAAIRDQLIIREIFAQEAEAKGFARNPDLTRQLEQMREDLLIRALIQDHLANVEPVTEDDVNREYQRLHGAASSDKEYRARHILVDKEEDARQIIAQLRKGEKFETLARRSRDIGSAQQGGDLDWATPDTYVKEFSEAMVALQKGDSPRNRCAPNSAITSFDLTTSAPQRRLPLRKSPHRFVRILSGHVSTSCSRRCGPRPRFSSAYVVAQRKSRAAVRPNRQPESPCDHRVRRQPAVFEQIHHATACAGFRSRAANTSLLIRAC